MTRHSKVLIGMALIAATILTGAAPAAADAKPDQAAIAKAHSTSDSYQVNTGRTPLPGVPSDFTRSEFSTADISCWDYWVEITSYTTLGFVHWKWKHSVNACYDGVVVRQWRSRVDQLTYADGTAFAGALIGDSATALPSAPASSYYQRRIDICYFYYGCLLSFNPWSRININGNGTFTYNWAVV